MIRTSICGLTLLLVACASHKVPPLPLDEPVEAHRIPEPPAPTNIVEVPQALPLPGQLKPAPTAPTAKDSKRAPSPKESIAQAVRASRVEPTRDGYVNATQVWPFMPGALYQVYTVPGRVTDISFEPGEELVSVSAGDTVRWVIGDTVSGARELKRVHVLVKPSRSDLHTNLVVNTDRRTYHLELTATPETWLASVSWSYPEQELAHLRERSARAESSAPIADGIVLEHLKFRYEVTGDQASWRPLRAFDDGEKVYIQFPPGIAEGEMPPLFVVGPVGDTQLVNYRVRAPYYIVDRLFAVAELRLGGKKGQVVRIRRSDLQGETRHKASPT
jgi:type IV secretion system protein TrbG